MTNNPCRPDCPDRNATCHATCERYQAFWAENQERLKKQLIDSGVKDQFYTAIKKAKKRKNLL